MRRRVFGAFLVSLLLALGGGASAFAQTSPTTTTLHFDLAEASKQPKSAIELFELFEPRLAVPQVLSSRSSLLRSTTANTARVVRSVDSDESERPVERRVVRFDRRVLVDGVEHEMAAKSGAAEFFDFEVGSRNSQLGLSCSATVESIGGNLTSLATIWLDDDKYSTLIDDATVRLDSRALFDSQAVRRLRCGARFDAANETSAATSNDNLGVVLSRALVFRLVSTPVVRLALSTWVPPSSSSSTSLRRRSLVCRNADGTLVRLECSHNASAETSRELVWRVNDAELRPTALVGAQMWASRARRSAR